MITIAALNDESRQRISKVQEIITYKQTALEDESYLFANYKKIIELHRNGNVNEAFEAYQLLLSNPLLEDTDQIVNNNLNIIQSKSKLKYSILKNLAEIYEHNKQYLEAIEYLIQAIGIDESEVLLCYKIGTIAEVINNYQLARYAYEMAIKSNAYHFPSVERLIAVLFILKNYNECLALIMKTETFKSQIFSAKIIKKYILDNNKYYKKLYKETSFIEEFIDLSSEKSKKIIDELKEIQGNINSAIPQICKAAVVMKISNSCISWEMLGKCLMDLYIFIQAKLKEDENFKICSITSPIIIKCNYNENTENDYYKFEFQTNEETVISNSYDCLNSSTFLNDDSLDDDNSQKGEISLVNEVMIDIEENNKDNGDASNVCKILLEKPEDQITRSRKRKNLFESDLENKRRSSRFIFKDDSVINVTNNNIESEDDIYDIITKSIPTKWLKFDNQDVICDKKSLSIENNINCEKLILPIVQNIPIDKNIEEYFFVNSSNHGIIELLDSYVNKLTNFEKYKWSEELIGIYIAAINLIENHIVEKIIDVNFIKVKLIYSEFLLNNLTKFKSIDDRIPAIEKNLIRNINVLINGELGSEENTLEIYLRVNWMAGKYHFLKNNLDYAEFCFIELLEKLDDVNIFLCNLQNDNIISKGTVENQLNLLYKQRLLNDIECHFDAKNYDQVIEVLEPIFCEEISKIKSVESHKYLNIFMDSLLGVESYQKCFKWGIYLLQKKCQINSEIQNINSNSIEYILECISKCLPNLLFNDSIFLMKNQLVTNLLFLLKHQLIPSNSYSFWNIFLNILKRLEKACYNELLKSSMLPSIVLIIQAHNFMGSKYECMCDCGIFLLQLVDMLTQYSDNLTQKGNLETCLKFTKYHDSGIYPENFSLEIEAPIDDLKNDVSDLRIIESLNNNISNKNDLSKKNCKITNDIHLLDNVDKFEFNLKKIVNKEDRDDIKNSRKKDYSDLINNSNISIYNNLPVDIIDKDDDHLEIIVTNNFSDIADKNNDHILDNNVVDNIIDSNILVNEFDSCKKITDNNIVNNIVCNENLEDYKINYDILSDEELSSKDQFNIDSNPNRINEDNNFMNLANNDEMCASDLEMDIENDINIVCCLEELNEAIEQALYCLFGQNSKSKYLQSHATKYLPFDWTNCKYVYNFYKPNPLPEYDSYKTNTATLDFVRIMKKIKLFVPEYENFDKVHDRVEAYILCKENTLPDSINIKDEDIVLKDLYYLFGDYYLKTNKPLKAISYFMKDLCFNILRFDSWAGIALSKLTILEEKLSAYNLQPSTDINQETISTLRCFTKALTIDKENYKLWIEYGSCCYILNSHISRIMAKGLPNPIIGYTETEDLLIKSKLSFSKALGTQHTDELWFLNYMLGKLAEKMGDRPDVYLNFYLKAGHYLHDEKAKYPKKNISYYNPPHLAIEALEMYFRFHVSISKYLMKNSDQMDCIDFQILEDYLSQIAITPFVKASYFSEKKFEDKINKLKCSKNSENNNTNNYQINSKPSLNIYRIPNDLNNIINTSPDVGIVDIVPKDDLNSTNNLCGTISSNDINKTCLDKEISPDIVKNDVNIESYNIENNDNVVDSQTKYTVENNRLQQRENVESIEENNDSNIDCYEITINEEDNDDDISVSSCGVRNINTSKLNKDCNINMYISSPFLKNNFNIEGEDKNSLGKDKLVKANNLYEVTNLSTDKYNDNDKLNLERIGEKLNDKEMQIENSNFKENFIENQEQNCKDDKNDFKFLENKIEDYLATDLVATKSKLKDNFEPPNNLKESKQLSNDLDSSTIEEEETIINKYRKIMTLCIKAFILILKRYPYHYKSVHQLALIYFHSNEFKDMDVCRNLLIGTHCKICEFNYSCSSLLNEKKLGNLFNGIWRLASLELDRCGSFMGHLNKIMLLLLQILCQREEALLLFKLYQQLAKCPDQAAKKYLRDYDRILLSQMAFQFCCEILDKQVDKCVESLDEAFKIDLLLKILSMRQHASKTSNEKLQALLNKAYSITFPEMTYVPSLEEIRRRCIAIQQRKQQLSINNTISTNLSITNNLSIDTFNYDPLKNDLHHINNTNKDAQICDLNSSELIDQHQETVTPQHVSNIDSDHSSDDLIIVDVQKNPLYITDSQINKNAIRFNRGSLQGNRSIGNYGRGAIGMYKGIRNSQLIRPRWAANTAGFRAFKNKPRHNMSPLKSGRHIVTQPFNTLNRQVFMKSIDEVHFKSLMNDQIRNASKLVPFQKQPTIRNIAQNKVNFPKVNNPDLFIKKSAINTLNKKIYTLKSIGNFDKKAQFSNANLNSLNINRPFVSSPNINRMPVRLKTHENRNIHVPQRIFSQSALSNINKTNSSSIDHIDIRIKNKNNIQKNLDLGQIKNVDSTNNKISDTIVDVSDDSVICLDND